ncbi:unnamed protein product [Gordionus sp. m RMFG-2023]
MVSIDLYFLRYKGYGNHRRFSKNLKQDKKTIIKNYNDSNFIVFEWETRNKDKDREMAYGRIMEQQENFLVTLAISPGHEMRDNKRVLIICGSNVTIDFKNATSNLDKNKVNILMRHIPKINGCSS